MKALNSTRLWIAVVAVATLLMSGTAYLTAISPARADKATVQKQINDASLAQAALRRKLALLEDASKQTATLRAAQAAATKAIPVTADTQGLLRQVQALATAQRVSVGAVTIAPPAETTVDGVWGLPVTIELAGDPVGMIAVVKALQVAVPRAMSIAGTTLTAVAKGLATVALDVTMFSTSAPLVQDGRVVGADPTAKAGGTTPSAGTTASGGATSN